MEPQQQPAKINNYHAQANTHELAIIPFQDLTVGRVIGRGAFGVVHEGKYEGKDVAIKVLHQLKQTDIEEFCREGRTMMNLQHPRIIRFTGACIEPLQYALVMELIPGCSLTDLLHSSAEVSWEERFQIAVDIAMGLSYLHSKDIVHCDVKSGNVLLDENRRAKLCDFGMARLKRAHSVYPTGQIGTLGWTAPEIVLDEGEAKNTKQVDVYAFGVVLWELGSRRAPFEGLQPAAIIRRLMDPTGKRDPISEDTPEDMASLIRRCCSFNPKDRPSMAEAVDALAVHLWPYRAKSCPTVQQEEWSEDDFNLIDLQQLEQTTGSGQSICFALFF